MCEITETETKKRKDEGAVKHTTFVRRRRE
jgi:hypothetical protein